ncbi:MAG: hypothetical protein ACJAYF_003193 [Arenicella sp.]|jgi:hypothetical protein
MSDSRPEIATELATELATEQQKQKAMKRLDNLAWALDSVVPLPGGFRLGLDGLIGLVPVVGDGITALLSSYVIGEGVRNGAPKSVILKMLANLLVDTVIGAIPFFGDVFDVVNRSNYKNVNLLRSYLDKPVEVKRASRLWVAMVVVGVISIIAASLWAFFSILTWLVGLF